MRVAPGALLGAVVRLHDLALEPELARRARTPAIRCTRVDEVADARDVREPRVAERGEILDRFVDDGRLVVPNRW